MKRKGISWKRGQNIRILKGACGGVHKNDIYATIDYFLIERFEDEAGGKYSLNHHLNNILEPCFAIIVD